MIKITTPQEPLPPVNAVFIFYGPPGVGKSSFGFTAHKPLLLDFDGGVERAVGRKDVAKINLYDEIEDMMEKDQFASLDFKTVIIDTGGAFLDKFAAEYVMRKDFKNKKGDGSLSLSGYGAIGVLFQRLVDYFMKKKIDIVIICHGVEKEGAGDTLRIRPKMTGGSYNVMMGFATMVGYMEMINGKCTLNFNPTDSHVGKNSAEFAPFALPHYTDPAYSNLLAELIQKTKDKLNAHSVEQAATLELITELTRTVAACSMPADFASFASKIVSHPEYIKAPIGKLMKDRMAECNVTFDRTSGQYSSKAVPATTTDSEKVDSPSPESRAENPDNSQTPEHKARLILTEKGYSGDEMVTMLQQCRDLAELEKTTLDKAASSCPVKKAPSKAKAKA